MFYKNRFAGYFETHLFLQYIYASEVKTIPGFLVGFSLGLASSVLVVFSEDLSICELLPS